MTMGTTCRRSVETGRVYPTTCLTYGMNVKLVEEPKVIEGGPERDMCLTIVLLKLSRSDEEELDYLEDEIATGMGEMEE